MADIRWRRTLVCALALMMVACGSDDSESPVGQGEVSGPTGQDDRAGSVTSPGAGGNAVVPAPEQAPAPVADATFIARTLEQVNAARATPRRCGSDAMPASDPVRWNVRIESAALAQGINMRDTNTLAHRDSRGHAVGERLLISAYAWSAAAENLAAGYPDTGSVVAAWLASASHCRNLMDAAFLEIGMGKIDGTPANTWANFWTLVLARPG